MTTYGTTLSTTFSGSTSNNLIEDPAPPQPAFLNIEGDFEQAYDTTSFALSHATAADGYIAQLGQLAAALVPPTINPTFPINTNAPTIETPSLPSLLPIEFSLPASPQPFSGSLDLSGTSFPTFDAQPPQLLFPNAPTPTSASLPSAPAIDLNFTYPTVSVDLPDPPDLISISVTPFDGVTFPVFDTDAPVLNLAAPQIINYVPNAPYTDALLSGLVGTLQTRLATGVNGTNTGLPAPIEENIWNRGREREAKQLADDLAALDRMEDMGYALPPGVFVDSQIKIRTEYAANSYGYSREVAIKQAELEQSNIQKSMELAVTIEGRLIEYANQTEQRRFDACKYATEAGVSIYNAAVQAYSARVQGYRAAVDVYSAQIAGARGIIEAYSAQIAAEKLKIDANLALIQEYKTRVDAALASIQVFEGEIKLVEAQAQIENLKVSIYGEEIKAYAAQVNVFTSQVEAYRSQVQAEGTKEQVYGTQAQTYGTLVDATYKSITAQVDVYKAELSAKTEEFEAYKAMIEAQSEQVKAVATANSATADIYKAEVTGTSAYNEAMIKEWEAINNLTVQIQQVMTSAAQANGNLYLTAKSVATDAAKVGAQVEAQIASSALGAVTWATHRSRQDSVGSSVSNSFSQSKSLSQSSSTSMGTNDNTNTNTSYSNSYSVSTSNSTATNHNIQSVE